MGIWLANQNDLEIDSVLAEFKEDLSMILIHHHYFNLLHGYSFLT
ncbi:hypothetical protein P4S68_18140 [Pseudoalteromonas sp. Hal099]